MIEEGLRTLLLDDSTISNLISTRCYGVKLPQKPTLPALLITRISGEDQYDSAGADEPVPGRFQIDCWAATLAESRTLSQAVKSALSGYSGSAGSETISGAFLSNQQDLYDAETEYHRRTMDFEIWYKE